jgi:hypothetical protein
MEATKKRFRCNEQKMLDVLQYLRDHHAKYKQAKRLGTVQEFFNTAGMPYDVAGTVVENMVKNLAKEYRTAVKDSMQYGEKLMKLGHS